MAANTFTGSDIADNSLRGADINESTLSLPPTTTATVAGQGNVGVGTSYTKVIGKTLPAGSYAIAATANVVHQLGGSSGDQSILDTFCELRNPGGAFIGGGRIGVRIQHQQTSTISLSMNGGVQVPAGGGEVGVYCRIQAQGISDRRRRSDDDHPPRRLLLIAGRWRAPGEPAGRSRSWRSPPWCCPSRRLAPTTRTSARSGGLDAGADGTTPDSSGHGLPARTSRDRSPRGVSATR